MKSKLLLLSVFCFVLNLSGFGDDSSEFYPSSSEIEIVGLTGVRGSSMELQTHDRQSLIIELSRRSSSIPRDPWVDIQEEVSGSRSLISIKLLQLFGAYTLTVPEGTLRHLLDEVE